MHVLDENMDDELVNVLRGLGSRFVKIGKGVGRQLILAVYEAAREAGCSRVYWLTHTTNAKGRALYDKVGEHHGFIMYGHELLAPADNRRPKR